MVAFEFDIYLRYASQVRKLFKDGKRQQLEAMAPDIAVGLSALAAGKHEDDRLAEEARFQAEEEARRRNEARRRTYIEERRGKALTHVVERLDRRNELRKLVAELSADLADSPAPRTAEFLRWATEALEHAEWAMSIQALEALFAREEVFGDKDDRGFYPTTHGW
jgi:hypothetical protein